MSNKLVFEQILTQDSLSKDILFKLEKLDFNEWLYSGDTGYIDIETTVPFSSSLFDQSSFNARIAFCLDTQNKENLSGLVYLNLGYFINEERFEYYNISFNEIIPFGQQVLDAIINENLSSSYLKLVSLFSKEHNDLITRLNNVHSLLTQ